MNVVTHWPTGDFRQPCPTCGHCPTCGRAGYVFGGPWWGITPPPSYQPWPGWPSPYITCDSVTTGSIDTSPPTLSDRVSDGDWHHVSVKREVFVDGVRI